MLTLIIPPIDSFNDFTGEFVKIPGGKFRFENSLKAIHRWEGKYKRPYLKEEPRTYEERFDYCWFMAVEDIPKEYITPEVMQALEAYCSESHTATTFRSQKNSSKKQQLTSELIYAYMALAGVPFECDEWEIGRLMTLLTCIGILQDPKGKDKKRPKSQIAKDYSKLNAQRLAKYNTKG